MTEALQKTGGGAAALVLLGLLLLFIGLAVPLLFAAGLLLAFLGIVLHILSPHHTHPPAWTADSSGHACPGCGTALTWRDDMTGKGWYCAKEQVFR